MWSIWQTRAEAGEGEQAKEEAEVARLRAKQKQRRSQKVGSTMLNSVAV